jgi:formylglycine-generating enzyme required for sulfatase activity
MSDHRLTTIMTGMAALGIAVMSGCTGDDEGLDDGLSELVGTYQVVDLDDGSVTTRTAIADLATKASYRDQELVFKLVEPGTVQLGSEDGAFAAQNDEPRTSATVERYYLAVFELTQAQWRRIADTTPWQDIDSALIGGDSAIADGRPACNLSHDTIAAVFAAWSARYAPDLVLPTAVEWEGACRAGAATTYPWGEARDENTVATWAVTWEITAGAGGARAVGARQANAAGIYDMVGNVWEATADDALRGGSWLDDLPQARPANTVTLYSTAVAYPTLGVRPVLRFGD